MLTRDERRDITEAKLNADRVTETLRDVLREQQLPADADLEGLRGDLQRLAQIVARLPARAQ
jgi:hypothetical protein